jgi:hypothetical protein
LLEDLLGPLSARELRAQQVGGNDQPRHMSSKCYKHHWNDSSLQ